MVDSHIQNEGNGWAGSGANPWHLDPDTESILFLTNESGQPARIGAQVAADGVTYYLTSLRLNPHETRVIDLRKLRDAQVPDFKKNLIPASATDGSVSWNRIDNVAVMGRLMVINRQQGMASNYDCSSCMCPLSYWPYLNYVSPASSNLVVQGTQGLILYAAYESCNALYFFIDVNGSDSWTSQYPNIASVNSSGTVTTVTGQSGGTTWVTAQYSDYSYMYNPVTYTCNASGQSGGGSGGVNVCTLSISSPANGQVFSLGGSNYNSATIPLEATSACSATANWTLLFDYTNTGGAAYTDTEVTSSTIGQTSNYSTPVGDGGELFLTASALLSGQHFTVNYTVYVDGTVIPPGTITSRLVGLYSGVTTGLLTGIAWVESSYQQFVSRSLYQVPGGLWPYETATGAYVGLMQVPNSRLNAFDWMTNTSQGLSIFNSKYSTVQTYVSNLQSQHSGLPNLSGSQYEDNQLILYGGWWTSNSSYYWVPNSTYAAWVQNTSSPGYSYVNNVRNNIQ